jgi:hypothetical protein
MKKISIEARDNTPAVILDKENGKMEIRGYSFPDEAFEFYNEIVSWFKDYEKDPNATTSMVFDFKYVNSTSAKYINDILKKLDAINASGKPVSIEWFFDEDDEDIQQLGNTLKEFHKATFAVTAKKQLAESAKRKLF